MFRVGILGMGRIAAGFDDPGGPAIQTHVKAILSEPRLSIACVSDLDLGRARSEVNRYGIEASVVSPEEILKANLDALCIATPDGSHLDYCRMIDGKVRVALVEKPLEGDGAQRRSVVTKLAERDIALVINHQRRWIPDMAGWIAEARAGRFGKPVSVVIHYSNGFRHNGVHAFDLVAAFVGTEVLSAVSAHDAVVDYGMSDPTRTLFVTLAGPTPVAIFGINANVQTAFSVDIRFEQARVLVFDESGIRAELFRAADIGVVGFSSELRPVSKFHDDPPRLLAEVWRNIADYLELGAPLACEGDDALAAYDLADSIVSRLPA